MTRSINLLMDLQKQGIAPTLENLDKLIQLEMDGRVTDVICHALAILGNNEDVLKGDPNSLVYKHAANALLESLNRQYGKKKYD